MELASLSGRTETTTKASSVTENVTERGRELTKMDRIILASTKTINLVAKASISGKMAKVTKVSGKTDCSTAKE